jgi:cyclopropane-fatty-acyl-phospholipid synthase
VPQLFLSNRNQLSNATTIISSIAATITAMARGTNTLSNSLLNVSAHYDISNGMFAGFLSEDMTYSCPIWKIPAIGEEEETLKAAQMTKLHRFIDEAKIKPSDHVLEIGTGWGSFAIEAARKTGCKITTLTLSVEQKALAEKRIVAAGYEDKIEVKLVDYRALPIPQVPYDKVVSIEMLEAVGKEYLHTYFECVHKLLKQDGGIAVFQCITMPECRYDAYAKGEDFIRKYIFPGGHLPSISQLIDNISSGSNGTLIVEKIENIGGHYAKTLRLWKERFLQNFESRIRPALMIEHKDMGEKEIEVFRRKWEVCSFEL